MSYEQHHVIQTHCMAQLMLRFEWLPRKSATHLMSREATMSRIVRLVLFLPTFAPSYFSLIASFPRKRIRYVKTRLNVAHSLHLKFVIQHKKLIEYPHWGSVSRELGLVVQLSKQDFFPAS